VTVYVDSSVLMRIVTGARDALREWGRITRALSSELIRVECLRTIDRTRLQLHLPDDDVAERRAALLDRLEAFELIALDRTVLERAAEPFPTALGTLDGVHLASAVLAREQIADLAVATHDRELAIAARAMNLPVLGASRLR